MKKKLLIVLILMLFLCIPAISAQTYTTVASSGLKNVWEYVIKTDPVTGDRYMLMSDENDFYRLKLMRYDESASSWKQIGDSLSDYGRYDFDMEVYDSNVYMIFQNEQIFSANQKSYKTVIMKYDGISFTKLFPSSSVNANSLSNAQNDIVLLAKDIFYFSYLKDPQNNIPTVMLYKNGAISSVSSPVSSDVYGFKLTRSGSDVYCSYLSQTVLKVMKLVGTSWKTVDSSVCGDVTVSYKVYCSGTKIYVAACTFDSIKCYSSTGGDFSLINDVDIETDSNSAGHDDYDITCVDSQIYLIYSDWNKDNNKVSLYKVTSSSMSLMTTPLQASGSYNVCFDTIGNSITFSFLNDASSIDIFSFNAASRTLITSISPRVNNTVYVARTTPISVSVAPVEAYSKNISYSSVTPQTVTVDASGVLTGVKNGEGVVIVSSLDGSNIRQAVYLNVKNVPVSSMSLASEMFIVKGTSAKIPTTFSPLDATVKDVSSSSSNSSIAKASGDSVVGVGVGECNISVKSVDNNSLTGTLKAIVINSHPTSISLGISNLSIVKGKTYSLNVTQSPSNSYKRYSFSSSNTSVASVSSSGVISANGYGCATIKVTTYNSKSASVNICVIPSAPSSIRVTNTGITSQRVDFSQVSDANGYYLYYSSSSSGKYYSLGTIGSDSSSKNVGSLTCAKTYYYKIRSYVNVNGVKYYSSYSPVSYRKLIPIAPLNVSANSYSYNSIKISFSKVSGASGYYIYRATKYNGTYSLVKTTTSNSFLDKSRTVNKTYYYKVRAYKIVNRSKINGSLSQVVSAKAVPSKPTSISISPYSATSVRLSWKLSSGSDSVKIYRSESPNGTFSYLCSTGKSAVSYVDKGLVAGKYYYYKIVSSRRYSSPYTDGMSSSVYSIRVVPPAPTGVKAYTTSNSSTSNTVKWNGVGNASGYIVYMRTPGASFSKIATTTSTSYVHLNLTTGRKYEYYIQAYASVNSSEILSKNSSVVYSIPKPVVPANVKFASLNASKFSITFDKSENATGYVIYRATSASGKYKKIATVKTNVFTYSSSTVGRYYYYKIRPYTNCDGANAYGSASKYYKYKQIPAKPSAVSCISEYNKITVTCTPVSGASGYAFYYSTSPTTGFKYLKSSSSKSITHTSLKFERTYYYKIRAYKIVSGAKRYGYYSNVVSARTVLSTPKNISIVNNSPSGAKMSWSAVSGANGYDVFDATNSISSSVSSKTLYVLYNNKTPEDIKNYSVKAFRFVNGVKHYSNAATM